MNYQFSLPNDCSTIVLDASVLINLNASGFSREILSALPYECVVPDQVIEELCRGRSLGHSDSQKVEHLVDAGELVSKPIGETGEKVFENLIYGDALTTLDDGEAATIALAIELSAIAIIDEKKALNLCERRFPDLPVVTTPDLLLHDNVGSSLGRMALADASFHALNIGRMRVPERHHEAIVDLIGVERAATCTSLPKRIRKTDEV